MYQLKNKCESKSIVVYMWETLQMPDNVMSLEECFPFAVSITNILICGRNIILKKMGYFSNLVA